MTTDLVLASEATRLSLPEDISFDEWREVGTKLGKIHVASAWWVGDWLNFGQEKGYVPREAYDEAERIVGRLKRKSLQDYAYVCRSVESSIRIEDLEFLHHRYVAPLSALDQSEWLHKAKKEGWSAGKLRKELSKARRVERHLSAPDGRFRVIYADPPWEYAGVQHDAVDESSSAECHYETMPLEGICSFEVEGKSVDEMADNDAVLFLWATSPLLEQAFDVVRAWGFAYKASFIWDKVKHNVGGYNSVRHELLLVATKGSCSPESSQLLDSVVVVERGGHSRKPDDFYDIIEMLYPSGRKLELFARRERDGWTSLGLEVPVAAGLPG